MKICIVGPSYPFRGGISHYMTLLYRHLKKYHETDFYSFKKQYPLWLFPGKTDKDISRETIREEGVEPLLNSTNPLSWWKIFRRIKSDNPDILILPWWVWFWTAPFWTICFLVKSFTNTRILFICHNVLGHEPNALSRICAKFVLRKGDCFVVHSTQCLNELLEIIPDADIRKTFHPTYDVFNFEAVDKAAAKRALSVEGRVILFFGFVRPYKGLNYLLDAMPIVLKELDVTLLIVGEFWKDKQACLDQIETLGLAKSVTIIDDYVPNEKVSLYFSSCDVVVLPYVSATNPGIVQIAFGLNKPVVATHVGALPEVVTHNKTGFVVPPRDSVAIADAILDFYKDHREQEFSANIRNEADRFSWDAMTRTVESFMG